MLLERFGARGSNRSLNPIRYDRKPVDDKIVSYLRSIDYSAKAREITEAIDYHPSHVGKQCRVMPEADIINRQEGGSVSGSSVIFDDWYGG
jgi:hypothetical protein